MAHLLAWTPAWSCRSDATALCDAHEVRVLWQALDPQGTGTIPAAEFMKSLAIFGGDNAFTPDEVCPVAPDEVVETIQRRTNRVATLI